MIKTVFEAVLSAAIFVLVATFANAGSATWDLNPGSGDWNKAANWTPGFDKLEFKNFLLP